MDTEPVVTQTPQPVVTATPKPVDKGVDVNFTSKNESFIVYAKNLKDAKKRGLNRAKHNFKNASIDTRLYNGKYQYGYVYNIHWKYNTKDKAFSKYRRNYKTVVDDIYDNDAESSYWAKKYKSKRKKVNKDKYIKLTTNYVPAVTLTSWYNTMRSMKTRAQKQAYLRDYKLGNYAVRKNAMGNGFVSIYGDMKTENLCNAENLPVSICS